MERPLLWLLALCASLVLQLSTVDAAWAGPSSFASKPVASTPRWDNNLLNEQGSPHKAATVRPASKPRHQHAHRQLHWTRKFTAGVALLIAGGALLVLAIAFQLATPQWLAAAVWFVLSGLAILIGLILLLASVLPRRG